MSTIVSVVMPSYNQGRFIREAIDSVLEQEGVNVELIVMDGGSDDETVEILRSYGDRLHFSSGPDDGQSWAINEGMRRTSGEIVCWLNSDDRFLPGALRSVVEAFNTDPTVEFITGQGRNIEEDGTVMGSVGARSARLWELIHHRNCFNQPSCFMRRELWFDVGGLDESLDYVMDWDLWIRCGCANSVFLAQELSDNRSYAENKTNSGGNARLEEISSMVANYTESGSPPVLSLYGMETTIKAADDPASDEIREISQKFMAGMADQISGIDGRGTFGRQFSFSVTPRRPGDQLGVTLSSLARYMPPVSNAPVLLRWSSEGLGSGQFSLEAVPEAQTFTLPFSLEVGQVASVEVDVIGNGYTPVGYREILGYFDKAGSI